MPVTASVICVASPKYGNHAPSLRPYVAYVVRGRSERNAGVEVQAQT